MLLEDTIGWNFMSYCLLSSNMNHPLELWMSLEHSV